MGIRKVFITDEEHSMLMEMRADAASQRLHGGLIFRLTARAEKAEKQFKILNETLQHVTAMYDNAMTAVATGSASDWERGYFCAVAKMIEMEGQVQPDAAELFRCGGDARKADPEDQEIFREHGLLPNS